MNIVIAPDSFKGSIEAKKVSKCIQNGVKKVFPSASCITIPLADGGEGTLDAILQSKQGETLKCYIHNPLGKTILSRFGIFQKTKCIIEVADAIGINLIPNNHKTILQANSYGVGELIKVALDNNCNEIYISLGGSATNDAGIGLLSALGIRFLDSKNECIEPIPSNIKKIENIDISGLDPRIHNTSFYILCDVNNHLCGPHGATLTYGKQKGADDLEIKQLETAFQHLIQICKKEKIVSKHNIDGSGAAGGLGFALLTFVEAKRLSGINFILDIVDFDKKIKNADLIITGEGKIDGQSIYGKVPIGVATRAAQYHIPTIAIVGSIGENADLVYDYNIAAIEACVSKPMLLDEAIKNSTTNIENATIRIMKSIQIGMSLKKEKSEKNINF